MPQHYLSNLASLQEILQSNEQTTTSGGLILALTPLRGYRRLVLALGAASLSRLRTHSSCRAVCCSPHAALQTRRPRGLRDPRSEALTFVLRARQPVRVVCDAASWNEHPSSCASLSVVERPSAFCYDSRLPVSSRAGSCEPSRRSSAVEQLIRNQQVLGSSPSAGSRFFPPLLPLALQLPDETQQRDSERDHSRHEDQLSDPTGVLAHCGPPESSGSCRARKPGRPRNSIRLRRDVSSRSSVSRAHPLRTYGAPRARARRGQRPPSGVRRWVTRRAAASSVRGTR